MTIAVHISGGLGNQMFQYAAARALTLRKGTELELDISSFRTDKNKREYMLGNYTIQGNVMKVAHPAMQRIRSYVRSKIGIAGTARVYGEKNNRFDSTVLNLPDGTYLLGHWQSEKYFEDCRGTIISDFTYKEKLSKGSQQILSKIQGSDSVSLHIRRGDYIKDPVAAKVLGTLPLTYYIRALQMMQEKNRNMSVFLFSDDPEWVRENVQITAAEVIYVTTGSACEDLELMRSCKSHVIANSSFSWWGAWLNTDKSKKVIAPKSWFADAEFSADDIVPESWTRL